FWEASNASINCTDAVRGNAFCDRGAVHPRWQRRRKGATYVDYCRYFVTTCTALRQPVFTQSWLTTAVTERLRQDASAFDFSLPAYCIMPDHVHLLLHPKSERADLLPFMKHFKQMTGFAYNQQTRQTLWQRGYDERILRDDEPSEAIARYILE